MLDKLQCISCRYACQMSTISRGEKPYVACFYIGITGIPRYDDGVTCYCYEKGPNHIANSVKNRIRKEYGKHND